MSQQTNHELRLYKIGHLYRVTGSIPYGGIFYFALADNPIGPYCVSVTKDTLAVCVKGITVKDPYQNTMHAYACFMSTDVDGKPVEFAVPDSRECQYLIEEGQ